MRNHVRGAKAERPRRAEYALSSLARATQRRARARSNASRMAETDRKPTPPTRTKVHHTKGACFGSLPRATSSHHSAQRLSSVLEGSSSR